MATQNNVPVVSDSINPKDQLANTGYTIEWVLEMLRTNNPKFMDALGNSKVKSVSFRINLSSKTKNKKKFELIEFRALYINTSQNFFLFQIEANDISEGKGLLSHVYRVVLTFDNSTSYSFIMKIPTLDCMDEMFKSMQIDDVCI
jgi:hypothetical protein